MKKKEGKFLVPYYLPSLALGQEKKAEKRKEDFEIKTNPAHFFSFRRGRKKLEKKKVTQRSHQALGFPPVSTMKKKKKKDGLRGRGRRKNSVPTATEGKKRKAEQSFARTFGKKKIQEKEKGTGGLGLWKPLDFRQDAKRGEKRKREKKGKKKETGPS